MARASKVALLVATALVVLTVAAGLVFASANTPSATTDQASQTTEYTAASSPNPDGLPDGRPRAPAGRWHDRRIWQEDPGQRIAPLMGDFSQRDGYWSLGEILQWIAIAALGGFAVGLMIWRPWRPRGGPAYAPWQTHSGAAPAAHVPAAQAAEAQTSATPAWVPGPVRSAEPVTEVMQAEVAPATTGASPEPARPDTASPEASPANEDTTPQT